MIRFNKILFLAVITIISFSCTGVTIIADEHLTDINTDQSTDSDLKDDTSPSTETETETDSDTVTDTDLLCSGVPSTFSWTASAEILSPPSDLVSIKDPTAVLYNNNWLVYATTVSAANDYSMIQVGFADFNDADSAVKTAVNINDNLTGYKAAPQLFYFAPQKLWYLVYQTSEPAYSTSSDPTDVLSWSPMTTFMPMPSLITDKGSNGIDYWIICDDTNCYMFFSALNDVLYRAKTTKDAFPGGFEGTTEIVMRDDPFTMYDACNVYKIDGTDEYLLLVSAIDTKGRYFRSWTSKSLDGTWTALADTVDNSFASVNNVAGADFASDGIGHGEILRTNPDETMTIDPCNINYLFSGLVKSIDNPDNEHYSIGLIQQ
ncbi:MAG: glycosyl hydrolase family 62 [Deltaproteobacteria bacterium]|nr:glycosyl hydrolase family 62 [Deltaproteobacteria bacterium]